MRKHGKFREKGTNFLSGNLEEHNLVENEVGRLAELARSTNSYLTLSLSAHAPPRRLRGT